MKYIFFLVGYISFLKGSEECIRLYTHPKKETYRQFQQRDIALCTLYKMAYEEKEDQKRKKHIETIKKLHTSRTIPYTTTLVCPDNKHPLYGVTPLDFALAKDLEFAGYLLNDVNVPISDNALHYLALGVTEKGFSKEYKKMLEHLLQKKVNINAEMKNKNDFNPEGQNTITPLGYYLQSLNGTYDPFFITTLLHAGAELRKANNDVKAYNAIALAIDPHEWDDNKNENIATSLVTHILYERLYTIKKDYLYLILTCNYMNKKYKTRIPKVLINYIGNMIFRTSDTYEDIQRALTKKDYIIEQPMHFLVGPAQAKIKSAIEDNRWLASLSDLHTILSLSFWQQHFKGLVCSLQQTREKYALNSK